MSQKGMTTVGTVVAIVLAVIGLVVVGFFVMMAIAINSFGSNK